MSTTIRERFQSHPMNDRALGVSGDIRDKATDLAMLIEHAVPDSREKSLALTKLEEAVFWANAALARHK